MSEEAPGTRPGASSVSSMRPGPPDHSWFKFSVGMFSGGTLFRKDHARTAILPILAQPPML
jgi:hypothetical protein